MATYHRDTGHVIFDDEAEAAAIQQYLDAQKAEGIAFPSPWPWPDHIPLQTVGDGPEPERQAAA